MLTFFVPRSNTSRVFQTSIWLRLERLDPRSAMYHPLPPDSLPTLPCHPSCQAPSWAQVVRSAAFPIVSPAPFTTWLTPPLTFGSVLSPWSNAAAVTPVIALGAKAARVVVQDAPKTATAA